MSHVYAVERYAPNEPTRGWSRQWHADTHGFVRLNHGHVYPRGADAPDLNAIDRFFENDVTIDDQWTGLIVPDIESTPAAELFASDERARRRRLDQYLVVFSHLRHRFPNAQLGVYRAPQSNWSDHVNDERNEHIREFVPFITAFCPQLYHFHDRSFVEWARRALGVIEYARRLIRATTTAPRAVLPFVTPQLHGRGSSEQRYTADWPAMVEWLRRVNDGHYVLWGCPSTPDEWERKNWAYALEVAQLESSDSNFQFVRSRSA